MPVLYEYRNNTDSTHISIPFSTLLPFMDIEPLDHIKM